MGHKSELSAVSQTWLTQPAGCLDSLSPTELIVLELREISLLRSWLLSDSPHARTINWNAVLGIGFATCLSAGIWTGIGLALAHVWR